MNWKMNERITIITLFSLCILIIVTTSVRPCFAVNADEQWRVVICSGILQDDQVSKAEPQVIEGLYYFFSDQVSVDKKAIDVLCDEKSLAYNTTRIPCTRKNLEKTFANIASDTRNIGKLVFYYTGQANRAGDTLRLNVRGPDIVHEELVKWLGAIEAKQKLIVLDCPCAGLASKDLADPNTIIVCSARGDQYDSPRFSDYFVPALLQWEPDKDDDGRLSLLEAFQITCRQVEEYYKEKKCYKSKNALLEDDGDSVPSQQPWLFAQSGKDGAKASKFYFR